jgi:hypothetical protein
MLKFSRKIMETFFPFFKKGSHIGDKNGRKKHSLEALIKHVAVGQFLSPSLQSNIFSLGYFEATVFI